MNLHELLRLPNPDNYYNKEAAKMAKDDYRRYLRIAREDAEKKFKRIWLSYEITKTTPLLKRDWILWLYIISMIYAFHHHLSLEHLRLFDFLVLLCFIFSFVSSGFIKKQAYPRFRDMFKAIQSKYIFIIATIPLLMSTSDNTLLLNKTDNVLSFIFWLDCTD